MDPKQIGLAFGLTIIAGLSTMIGSFIAFITKNPNKKFLSFTLGLSAGVMIYISLAELLNEAIVTLNAGYGEKLGYLYGILAFFGGIALILIIDRLVPESANPHEVKTIEEVETIIKDEVPVNLDEAGNVDDSETKACCCKEININCETASNGKDENIERKFACLDENIERCKKGSFRKKIFRMRKRRRMRIAPNECVKFSDCEEQNVKKSTLLRSGLLTALAIAIHNFPEGMATFVSGLQGLGVALPIVIAISLHNIPEGMSVSVPIYYATGSRKKAFFWSAISGFAEPLGALFAYLILMPFFSTIMLGFLNSFVAGIMVFIALDELLPSAIQIGETHLPIYGVIVGMAIMALSLFIFV